MRQPTTISLLQKLLLAQQSRRESVLAWLALFAGSALLFLALLFWINFNELLYGKTQNDSLGSTFLVINKEITSRNMTRVSEKFFTEAEINKLKQAPQVTDVGLLTPASFPITAAMGSSLGFYTDLFLEAVPDNFIDVRSEDWKWRSGDAVVPLILSEDFLNLYNFGFAPTQGLPQLSTETVKTLSFQLHTGSGAQKETYIGQVVGFSNRISSVLAPQSFIDYGNKRYAKGAAAQPMRIILKTRDPSDKAFETFLKDNHYNTNAEMLRWNKVRNLVGIAEIVIGGIALTLLGCSFLVFSLFIKLNVAKARDSIQLLLEQGYSPKSLAAFLNKRFAVQIITAISMAVLLCAAVQVILASSVKALQFSPSYILSWKIIVVALAFALLYLYQIKRVIRKALRQV